ncbi:MAG TPA: GNAT family N-acetyltransferase [Blastocatellia bacterium]|nr:GNAT family N-acetyltransferase [Blastocatellia bacterium]
MEFTLRPAGPDDEDFLYKLYATTRSREIEAMGLPPEQQELFLRMQFVAQKLSYESEFPEPRHQIILFEGRPAGRVMTKRMEKVHRYIDLAILPEYQNLGIGRRIIEDLIKESAEAGLTARLHVLKSNRARLLYERLGFVVTGEDDFNYIMEIAPDR